MKRLAIYAHYDANGEIKPYVLYYLKELKKHCSRIDFISTATLSNSELSKVDIYCDTANTKINEGYDFGMWKYVLDQTGYQSFDELLITNSSVFGPIRPLSGLFDKMKTENCDFWGITDNFEMDWHIQSYFLVFRKNVLSSQTFKDFWNSFLPYTDKFQIIRSYEVGLSNFLIQNGFKAKAYIPSTDLNSAFHIDAKKNPTCYHPLKLLKKGMPFIKVELLRENPVGARLGPVYKLLEKMDYDLSLIEFDKPIDHKGSFKKLFFRMIKGILVKIIKIIRLNNIFLLFI